MVEKGAQTYLIIIIEIGMVMTQYPMRPSDQFLVSRWGQCLTQPVHFLLA